MNGTTECTEMVVKDSLTWLPIVNVFASIVLAGAALWSLRTAGKIAAIKNPAPYGQLRILWILERLVEDLKTGDKENAQTQIKGLNLHFFDHANARKANSRNTESGDWYFVWEMEKAFGELLMESCVKIGRTPIAGKFREDVDLKQALSKACAMWKIQRKLIDEIHKG